MNYWPQGYREAFQSGNPIEPLKAALDSLPGGGGCLEIGCGDGYWTNKLLVPKFDRVVCVDIIEKPKYFKGEYHQQTGTSLKQFREKFFNTVYSFGVFCHLSLDEQSSYLKEIRRVLKGRALIMFANWPRHYALKHMAGFVDGWHYNDLTMTKKMVENCGFQFIDFDPSYRDTIGILW